MDYPPAVLEKAQRVEQLLQRVAAGEPLEAVNAALDLVADDNYNYPLMTIRNAH